jgi:hypothetical protein
MYPPAPPCRIAFAALVAAALAGCAGMPRHACAPGEQRLVHESIYFGTATPTGVVTPAQWSGFLGDTVTPRFPQGLSVSEASGQWRGADGTIVKEASHVLDLLHPDDAASEKAIVEIVAAYKAQFRQEAVLRVRSQACASF